MKLNLTGRHLDIDPKMADYVEKKIGDLERFLPRGMRDGVEGHVVLEMDPSGREDNQFVCEVILNVPEGPILSKEATVSVYAAIDIVEAKLKAQLAKYKAKHASISRRERLTRRLMGTTADEEDVPASDSD